MSFLRASTGMPAGIENEKKSGELHDVWQVPPSNEHDIIAGVVNILKHLDELSQHDELSDALVSTREVIAFAVETITDAGLKLKEAETCGLINGLKVLSEFKKNQHTYVGNMEKLGRSFANITITQSTVEDWRKLALWLQALHDFTANDAKNKFEKDDEGFIKKLDDGTYPHTCFADGIFKKGTSGVSKYTLIYNYGVAAKLLGNGIANFEGQSPAPAFTK